MQTSQSADDSTTVVATAAANNIAQSAVLEMLDNDCSKHGKCGDCQSSNPCSNCPLSLGVFQTTPKRTELDTRIQLAVSDVSFHSADLLPDYRPPRYS
jgi:positive regulator of sigma E activity